MQRETLRGISPYNYSSHFINKKRSLHMPRFHRHGPRFSHHGGPFNGAIWMVGIGVMMLWGHWWPGILVLIGISMVFGTLWRGESETSLPTMPPMQSFQPQPPVQRTPTPTQSMSPAQPVSSGPRIDLLPATCPRCGAPVRSPDVKWRGEYFAACSYCGSNVVTRNDKKS